LGDLACREKKTRISLQSRQSKPQRFLWWNKQREHTIIAPGIELPAAVLAVPLALLRPSLFLVLDAAGGAPSGRTAVSAHGGVRRMF